MPDRVQMELELYRKLTAAGSGDDVDRFLADVLALVLPCVHAEQGLIEIDLSEGLDGSGRRWKAERLSGLQVETIRGGYSRGIVARAQLSGTVISTVAAVQDPRFRDLRSVRDLQLDAVLCAPIGQGRPLGVLYVQHHEKGGAFSPEDERLLGEVARLITPLAERLAARVALSARRDLTLPYRARLRLDSLAGSSEGLCRLFQHLAQALDRQGPVLLCGPAGAGHTTVARALHDNGPWRDAPFEELDGTVVLGASEWEIPDWWLAAATGRTLALRSLLPLSLAAQEALAAALTRLPSGVGTVVVSADSDLHVDAREGRVLDRLHNLLRPCRVRIPALEHRREDISAIAQLFLDRFTEVRGARGLGLSPSAIESLNSQEWPGQLHQLRDRVEAAAERAMIEGVEQVRVAHLHEQVGGVDSFQEATRRFQRAMIVEAIESTNGNLSEVARRLDVTRAHVYNLMRSLGIEARRAEP